MAISGCEALVSSDETQIEAEEKGEEVEEQEEREKWGLIETKVSANVQKINNEWSNNEIIFTKSFPKEYQDVEGILTFRGDPFRNNAFIGNPSITMETLSKEWKFQTSVSPRWGGGAGWVGQASVISWEENEKDIMPISQEFKEKKDFKEVIYGSLDGKVYFLDLDTGKETREPIAINNPIKGSVALDPRGYPLLYVGQGIPQTGEIGYRIYSLIDGSLLAFIPGIDSYSYRRWGAFDGAPLIHKEEDAMIIGGENGLIYFIKLNTSYKPEDGKISIEPVISKYRYKQENNPYQGMENSVAVYKNIAYYSDNGGGIHALDIIKKEPFWSNDPFDDTDATIVIDEENENPYIYTGSQIDKQGSKGVARIQKLNGLDGRVMWEKKIPGFSLLGDSPVNGGVLGTPIIGEGPLKGQVIYNISRFKTFNGGLLISLDKETGEEVWRWEMPNYSWSSTVAVYGDNGKAYFVQGDSVGNIYLLNGRGKVLNSINLGANIEASPIVVDNQIVVATRGGNIYKVNIH